MMPSQTPVLFEDIHLSHLSLNDQKKAELKKIITTLNEGIQALLANEYTFNLALTPDSKPDSDTIYFRLSTEDSDPKSSDTKTIQYRTIRTPDYVTLKSKEFGNSAVYERLKKALEDNNINDLSEDDKKIILEHTEKWNHTYHPLDKHKRTHKFVSRHDLRSMLPFCFWFVLLGIIALPAEGLYAFFQEKTTEDGLSDFFPKTNALFFISWVLSGFDFYANVWTISPVDDIDEHMLDDHTAQYTPFTLMLYRVYMLSSALSFPIGAAGGWLGLMELLRNSKLSKSTRDELSILGGLTLIPAGTTYYIAWNSGNLKKTFQKIGEYYKTDSTKHDFSFIRYAQAFLVEGFSVSDYRALGFAAIMGLIFSDGLKQDVSFAIQLTSALVVFIATFITVVLTRIIKITPNWLHGLQGYILPSEYREAQTKLQWHSGLVGSRSLMKLLMSACVSVGIALMMYRSVKNPTSASSLINMIFLSSLPMIITMFALRSVALNQIAMETVTEEVLEERRNWEKEEKPTRSEKQKMFHLACSSFNALASTFKDGFGIFWCSAVSSGFGRVARGASFLGFSKVLSVVGINLTPEQQLCMALIFAPHNLLNEFITFRDGMIEYMSQKEAQMYVYYCIDTHDADEQNRPSFFMWGMENYLMPWKLLALQAKLFFNGKVDFTPNEVLYALNRRKYELLQKPMPQNTVEELLRTNDSSSNHYSLVGGSRSARFTYSRAYPRDSNNIDEVHNPLLSPLNEEGSTETEHDSSATTTTKNNHSSSFFNSVAVGNPALPAITCTIS